MVSLETASRSIDPNSSPRISFSADFLDERSFISITPNSQTEKKLEKELNAAEFEFLSSNFTTGNMSTADELIFEGKLLPYWQIHHAEKLNKISLKTEHDDEKVVSEKQGNSNKEENKQVNWFIDDDPSPRPPTCNVLWKELLRLKKQKQRPSSLSPSSSSSSSSSNSEISSIDESKEKNVNTKIKKRLERSKSATIRVRPLVNVPICIQGKNSSLPPLFPLKKGRVER